MTTSTTTELTAPPGLEPLDALRTLEPRTERAQRAQKALLDTDARIDSELARRDMAVLCMLRPYDQVQAKHEPEIRKLKAQFERAIAEARAKGDAAQVEQLQTAWIDKDTALRAPYVEALRAVPYAPTAAGRVIGVSRSTVAAKIRAKAPAPEHMPDWDVARAEQEAARAVKALKTLRPLRKAYEQIRNDTILTLLAPEISGGDAMRNADVARLLDVTTARIAQLRTNAARTRKTAARKKAVGSVLKKTA